MFLCIIYGNNCTNEKLIVMFFWAKFHFNLNKISEDVSGPYSFRPTMRAKRLFDNQKNIQAQAKFVILEDILSKEIVWIL